MSSQRSYLVPYDPNWPQDFQKVATEIQSVLGGAIELHHMGSTAIPGLVAKDCIDVLGVVDDFSVVTCKTEALASVGYQFRGAYGIEGRAYFVKPYRKVHWHVYPKGHPQVDRQLRFVQIMNGNPALVTELNRLKKDLLKQFPNDKNAYQHSKAAFYDKVLVLNPMSQTHE